MFIQQTHVLQLPGKNQLHIGLVLVHHSLFLSGDKLISQHIPSRVISTCAVSGGVGISHSRGPFVGDQFVDRAFLYGGEPSRSSSSELLSTMVPSLLLSPSSNNSSSECDASVSSRTLVRRLRRRGFLAMDMGRERLGGRPKLCLPTPESSYEGESQGCSRASARVMRSI